MSFNDARAFYLGGQTRGIKWFSFKNLRWWLALALYLVGSCVLLLLVPSIILLIALAGLLIVVLVVISASGEEGERWDAVLSEKIRWAFAARYGWDEWDPAMDRGWPMAVPPIREIGVSAAEGMPELAILRTGDEHYIAVLEIEGSGEGLRHQRDLNLANRRMGRLLQTLCSKQIPVDQITIMTSTRPARNLEYAEWLAGSLTPLGSVDRAMWEAADTIPFIAQQSRSWLVIRMLRRGLGERSIAERGRMTEVDVAETAYNVVAETARHVQESGIRVIRGLTPPLYRAMVRSLLLPEYDFDDTTHLTDLLSAIPFFSPAMNGRALMCADTVHGSQKWWHSVGDIPLRGWPNAEVDGRWLEPMVVDCAAEIRTVVAQYGLSDRQTAQLIARSEAAEAGAHQISEEKEGVIGTGEAQLRRDVAMMVLDDITRSGAGGIRAMVRVMTSSGSPRDVLDAREQVVSTATGDMGLQSWRWRDRCQAHAVMAVLPFGKGMGK